MACEGIEIVANEGLTGILSFPNTCDYYFFAKIMAAFFIVVTLTVYFYEKEKIGKSDILSCMGVSSIATIVVALFGTLLGLVETDIFTAIFVMGMLLVAIWVLKND